MIIWRPLLKTDVAERGRSAAGRQTSEIGLCSVYQLRQGLQMRTLKPMLSAKTRRTAMFACCEIGKLVAGVHVIAMAVEMGAVTLLVSLYGVTDLQRSPLRRQQKTFPTPWSCDGVMRKHIIDGPFRSS